MSRDHTVAFPVGDTWYEMLYSELCELRGATDPTNLEIVNMAIDRDWTFDLGEGTIVSVRRSTANGPTCRICGEEGHSWELGRSLGRGGFSPFSAERDDYDHFFRANEEVQHDAHVQDAWEDCAQSWDRMIGRRR
jgi:hypothetical protein